MKRSLVFVAFICLFTNPVFSQPSFSPEINRVAVFKNGYAFTYREAETTVEDGWAYTTKTPVGVLGTIWGYSTSPKVRVTQLLASESESRETERVTNLMEFILANEGAQVRIDMTGGDGKTRTLQGTYEVISSMRGFKGVPQMVNNQYYESQIVQRFSEMSIALKTETGVQVFPASRIETVEVIGQPKWMRPKTVKQTRLSIKTEGAAAGEKVNLGIAALERGIRWIPSYRVEVKGAPIKEAKLELEAMLINELADLKDTDVYFVVGVPHFLFQDTMSPLSINTAFAGVSSYFQAGAGSSRRDSYINVTSQISSQADGSYGDDQNRAPSPTLPNEEQLTSFSAEQLYLYQANKTSLKKGERSSLRLFSLTVPCTEVFEWTLNDDPDTQKRYLDYYSSSSSQQIKQDLSTKVWYALRLKNETNMPWTTAPAITFREWKPIGQDMMTFTPTGTDNILRVTPATEVIGSHTVEEKSRERMQLSYGGSTYNFDLVTVEGKIKLKNIKKEAVEVVLTRNVIGEVLSAGDEGRILRQGLNLQMVNPNSTIKWNLKIPGGEKEIVYSYKIYIRR
jgi:hypothetical protein